MIKTLNPAVTLCIIIQIEIRLPFKNPEKGCRLLIIPDNEVDGIFKSDFGTSYCIYTEYVVFELWETENMTKQRKSYKL